MAETEAGPAAPRPGDHPAAVHWLADYVYGTIATLVAIAGLTFESNPGELTTAGVVIVGAVAIWFAHTLSRLVSMRSKGHMNLRPGDVWAELRDSWSIVTAAIPATAIFVALGITIGLPFLMLGATSPLLQAWLARLRTRGIPYRLFALSNLASLLALAAYPTLIEPHFTLRQQRLGWCCGFAGR